MANVIAFCQHVPQYHSLLSQASEFFSHKPPYSFSLGVYCVHVWNVIHFLKAHFKEKCIWIKCFKLRKNRLLNGFLTSKMGKLQLAFVSIQLKTWRKFHQARQYDRLDLSCRTCQQILRTWICRGSPCSLCLSCSPVNRTWVCLFTSNSWMKPGMTKSTSGRS